MLQVTPNWQVQVTPDWQKSIRTPEEFNELFPGLTFRGPGTYLTDKDTVLVLMRPPAGQGTKMRLLPWATKGWPEGTVIHAFVYNTESVNTILGHVPPTRQDDRS